MRRLREVTSKAVDHLQAKTATALLQARVYKQKPVHRHIPSSAPPITLIPSLPQRLHFSSSSSSPQRPNLITMSNEIVHETIKGRFPVKKKFCPAMLPLHAPHPASWVWSVTTCCRPRICSCGGSGTRSIRRTRVYPFTNLPVPNYLHRLPNEFLYCLFSCLPGDTRKLKTLFFPTTCAAT